MLRVTRAKTLVNFSFHFRTSLKGHFHFLCSLKTPGAGLEKELFHMQNGSVLIINSASDNNGIIFLPDLICCTADVKDERS